MNLAKEWKVIIRKGGMGRKLAIYILLFSSVVTLLSTAVQLGLEYRHDVDAIKTDIAQVQNVYSLSLASSLWVTSKKDLQLKLDGIMRMPDMQYLEVISDTGEVQAKAGQSRSEQTIAHEFPLYYAYRGQDLYLGKLRVEASLVGVYERLQNKVVVILIAQSIKTFLVSLFILFLFQRLVGRHLNTLAQHFREVGTAVVEKEVSLARKKGAGVLDDELDLLVVNINDNAQRLKQANQNMRVAGDAALLEQENLAITLNSIGDAVIATDARGNITRMNPVAERLTGWSLADASGQPLVTVFHIINAETRLRVANPVQLVLEHGQVVGLANHTALLARDGTEHQIADSAAPIRDATNAIVGVVLVFSDVTEKYRTEASLRASKDHLQTTLNAIPDLLFEVDVTGCVLSYHAHRSDLLAAPPAVFLGKSFADVLPPAATEICMNALKEAAVKGWSIGAIYALPLPQGETWFELSVAAMPVVADAEPRFILLARDITMRKQTEAALQEKERVLSESQRIAHIGGWSWDFTGPIQWTEETYRLYGVAPETFTPTFEALVNLIHPEDRPLMQEWTRACGEDEKPAEIEFRCVWPDGTVRALIGRGERINDSEHRPIRIVGTVQDITDRKRTDEALRANKDRLAFLLSSSPAIIYTCEAKSPYAATYISENIIDLMGFHPQQFTASPNFWADNVHPEDRPRVFEDLGELFVHGHHGHEYRFRMADGTYHWIFDRIKVVYSATGEPEQLIGYWADIDDLKRIDAELRKSEENHRKLFESNPHPMWVYDLETLGFIAVNDAAIRHYGFSREEFLTMTIKDIRPPEDVPRLLDNINRVSEGVDDAGFWNHCKKDGSVIIVEIVSHTLNFAGRNAELVLAHDVTERKSVERGIELVLAEKTALLNEVHHRVKNNLQVITSLLRLEGLRSTDAPTQTVLQDMQGRVRSMALLHETVYRKGTFAAVELGSYLGQIAGESLKTLLTRPGAVQLRMDMSKVHVGLDQATSAGMLVSELLSNSLKHAFPNGRNGEIVVSLHPTEASGRWRLEVSDNGIGLPADFETKRNQSLGLQLAGDMALQLGGQLQVGLGPQAVFTVEFLAEEPKALSIGLNGDKP